jgi:hypothetical protein
MQAAAASMQQLVHAGYPSAQDLQEQVAHQHATAQVKVPQVQAVPPLLLPALLKPR